MLTTSARGAAHSMAAISQDSSPKPYALSTLPTSSRESGATPRWRPLEAAPVPAMVAATCVPWPCRSTASASSVKLAVSVTWRARSGWVASTPVSSTAKRGRLRLRLVPGERLDAGQRPLGTQRGAERGGARIGRTGVLDDQRGVGRAPVVVPVADQHGHVEQGWIQHPPHQGCRVGGDHPHVPVAAALAP